MDCAHSDQSLLVLSNLEEFIDAILKPCDLIIAELASRIQRLEPIESSSFIPARSADAQILVDMY